MGSTFTIYLPIDYENETNSLATERDNGNDESKVISSVDTINDRNYITGNGNDIDNKIAPQTSKATNMEIKDTTCKPPIDFTLIKDKNALVVDDDMRNTFILNKTLKNIGMSVVMASNGADAIEELNKDVKFDIRLLA
jgi:hypothetical protein